MFSMKLSKHKVIKIITFRKFRFKTRRKILFQFSSSASRVKSASSWTFIPLSFTQTFSLNSISLATNKNKLYDRIITVPGCFLEESEISADWALPKIYEGDIKGIHNFLNSGDGDDNGHMQCFKQLFSLKQMKKWKFWWKISRRWRTFRAIRGRYLTVK